MPKIILGGSSGGWYDPRYDPGSGSCPSPAGAERQVFQLGPSCSAAPYLSAVPSSPAAAAATPSSSSPHQVRFPANFLLLFGDFGVHKWQSAPLLGWTSLRLAVSQGSTRT